MLKSNKMDTSKTLELETKTNLIDAKIDVISKATLDQCVDTDNIKENLKTEMDRKYVNDPLRCCAIPH